jgi:nicotinamidase-related amidase
MNTSTLNIDPKTSALVLIDLQYGIVGMNVFPRNSAQVIANATKLVESFRKHHATVVLVSVGNLNDGHDLLNPITDAPPASISSRPANFSTLVTELNVQPSDLLITKRQWGAFYGTELDSQLRRRGVKTIVLGGISTNVGVESTARDAYERNYDQIFVEDAMASPTEEAHHGTLKYVFPRLGRIRNTQDVISALG